MEIKHRAHPTIPARGRKRFVIHHEKLYLAVHRYLTTRWFRYTVLFFIVGAIFSVICSSFESSAPYRLQLYSFCYLASFVFTVEYVLRIIAAPVQYRQYRAWRSRFRYLFSFYGLIDFVAVIPFLIIYLYRETIFVHLAVLAYILMIFKLIRYSRSFQLIGRVLQMVKDELITACTACGILLGFSGTRGTTRSLCQYRRRFLVGCGDVHHRGLWGCLSGYGIGTVAERCDLYGRHCDDSHSHWSYIFGFHEFDSRKETEGGRRTQKLISGKGIFILYVARLFVLLKAENRLARIFEGFLLSIVVSF